MHWPLQQLQLGDLPFGLSVGPRLGDSGGHGIVVGGAAFENIKIN
jgi:hypothetical protein